MKMFSRTNFLRQMFQQILLRSFLPSFLWIISHFVIYVWHIKIKFSLKKETLLMLCPSQADALNFRKSIYKEAWTDKKKVYTIGSSNDSKNFEYA